MVYYELRSILIVMERAMYHILLFNTTYHTEQLIVIAIPEANSLAGIGRLLLSFIYIYRL